jgi:hypothetical protein
MSFVDSESVQTQNTDGEVLTSVLFKRAIRVKTRVKRDHTGFLGKKFEFRLEAKSLLGTAAINMAPVLNELCD